MKADIAELNDYVFARTRMRLEGLTDGEYLWEPTPGCWSVRPGPGGTWTADGPARDGVGPLTTIAWRLWHLTDCYGSSRNAEWLGLATSAEPDSVPASTAVAALAILDEAAARWSGVIGELTDGDLTLPLGPIAGPFAESSRLGFVLHMIDEQIHHGAEIALLRDLYLASAGGELSPRPGDAG
jgi:hypothetical protein